MASIKTISDAIIARLVDQVADLDADKVKTFDGSARDLLDAIKTAPFVGVALTNVEQEQPVSTGKVAMESLTFNLLLVAEDFSGIGYSIEDSYGLIDSVRNALMGQTLNISGLDPIEVASVEKNTSMESEKITAYDFKIKTGQVVQQV